jgi:hypothetical protein
MHPDTKGGVKTTAVLVAAFLYLGFWNWLWKSSEGELLHSALVIGSIAIPLIVWIAAKKLSKKVSSLIQSARSHSSRVPIRSQIPARSETDTQLSIGKQTTC